MLEQSQSRQRSEHVHRLNDRNRELNIKLKDLLDIRNTIFTKRNEIQILGEQAFELVNQDGSSSITPKGLRNVAGNTNHNVSSMSWDFEDLKGEHGLHHNPENEIDKLDKVIEKMEKELTTNQMELNVVMMQREMQGQIKNEHDLKNYGKRQEEPMKIEDMSYVTTRSQDALSSSKLQEMENLINLQNQRIEELLEKSKEQERQKEELLRVNHKWDEQYRLLKDDKDRAISELRTKLKAQMACEAELQGNDVDFSRLNQQKIMQIAELTRTNEELSEEVGRRREKQEKTDQLWVAAKKMIDEERDARVSATQETQVEKERYKKLENEFQNSKNAQDHLKIEIERLTAFYCSDRNSNGSPSLHGGSALPSKMTEQIEVLKQQIRVYADDFSNERSDRERIQAEKELLKEKLKTCENDIAMLKEQVRLYLDDFNKERQEKERLQRQLRDRRPVTVQSQDEPFYLLPPQDYVSMGGVNAGQRRQVLIQERNYRPPAYSPREIQELAFRQQQQLRPRGNNGGGHPGGGLCHGCVADNDVIDGAGDQQTLTCPRCDRKFSSQERRAFEEHIDKCTT